MPPLILLCKHSCHITEWVNWEVQCLNIRERLQMIDGQLIVTDLYVLVDISHGPCNHRYHPHYHLISDYSIGWTAITRDA